MAGRSQRGSRVRVSPRMLYEMAKRYDEWEGENYEGSSCRGAIKGWYNMGVCTDRQWPYVPEDADYLTLKRAKAARENTVGAYYRSAERVIELHPKEERAKERAEQEVERASDQTVPVEAE